jgi:hypothetical protein
MGLDDNRFVHAVLLEACRRGHEHRGNEAHDHEKDTSVK